MIHFTARAKEWTRRLQESMGRQGSGLRIAVTGGGICAGYEYFVGFEDEPGKDDLRFPVDDFVVYIDPISYQEVKGAKVDFTDSPEGSGFVVTLNEEKVKQHKCCCSKDGILDEEKKKQVAALKAKARAAKPG